MKILSPPIIVFSKNNFIIKIIKNVLAKKQQTNHWRPNKLSKIELKKILNLIVLNFNFIFFLSIFAPPLAFENFLFLQLFLQLFLLRLALLSPLTPFPQLTLQFAHSNSFSFASYYLIGTNFNINKPRGMELYLPMITNESLLFV